MKNALSLKQSTFITIIIASACLISVFTYLTLTSEAHRSAEHQIRETHLRLLLAKEILEAKLRVTPEGRDPVPDLADTLQKLEQDERAFEYRPILLSKEGAVLYPSEMANRAKPSDQNQVREIAMTYDLSGKWFHTLPTPGIKDSLDLYTLIFSNHAANFYFLKTTVTLDTLKTAFQKTYESVLMIFLTVILVAFFIAYNVSQKIISPIKKLSSYASEVAHGNLDQKVVIETGDEIEELSRTFNIMTEQVSEMRKRAEDANPLTHLPGNNVITTEINRRLAVGQKIAVIHSDLDRFKTYNDSYGLKRGDEVIRMASEVLQESVSEKGSATDLVAHEGGDDFIVVTTPDCLEAIAKTIMAKFEARVGNHYRKEDRERQYVLIKDRRSKNGDQPQNVEIPLMSVSLAAVTNTQKAYDSYTQIAADLVAIKKQAKSILGNSFVVG